MRALQIAASESAGKTTLYQHRNEPLYSTTVAGAGTGGVPASSDVWSVLQRSTALCGDSAAMAAVASLASESACWREVQVDTMALDDVLARDEIERARVIKIDVEGGEWAVLRGMTRLLHLARDVEIVVEISPKWLRLQSSSAAALFAHMRQLGFHAYALPREDYEITRCFGSVAAPRAFVRYHHGALFGAPLRSPGAAERCTELSTSAGPRPSVLWSDQTKPVTKPLRRHRV